jgi:ferredoxin
MIPPAFVLQALAFLQPDSDWKTVAVAAALVVICIGFIAALTRFSQRTRSSATLRLDHFLPFVRKRRFPAGPPALVVRWAHRLLPASFFFDPTTGAEGTLRRLCRKIGPTVLAAPLRRIVQALCFVTFLTLFFVVCWPYNARPVTDGRVSDDWGFREIDQATGELRFAPAVPKAASIFAVNDTVFLANQGQERTLLSAGIVQIDKSGAALLPVDPLSPEATQELLLGSGTWAFHEIEPGKWPSHYADNLASKENLPADIFLILDPLVSISTAIASRSWVWSLISAGVILIVCILIPRGFCGYLCPLGTLIDLFDWAIGKRVTRFRVKGDGWWVHIKYYLLAATLIAAAFGVLVSGFVAAIPVITRGMLFLGDPLQSGLLRGWHLVPEFNVGHIISIVLFLAVLGLGLLRPRFWCKYVCPSGAVFSLGNLFRVTERKVESSCIQCNKCVTVCPFDAIKPDFTTRVTDCTLCQTCGGVCPSHSIKFVERWNVFDLKDENVPVTGETAIGRRGFVSLATGTAAAVAGGAGVATATRLFGANLYDPNSPRPVRPPGSVPEEDFLQMCIRCGECFKACPNNVLQPLGFEQGLQGLWTPAVNADWAGCESSCNACGQVCPTGAILPLPLAEKKKVRMGLAIVNETTCLPFAGREACQLCVDECDAAGYHAIEFTRVGTEVDADGVPLEGTGYLAPVVLPDKCVGCGLCQTRCSGINADQKKLLAKSAIIVHAGDGREDRFTQSGHVDWQKSRVQPEARRVEPPVKNTPDASGSDDPFGDL